MYCAVYVFSCVCIVLCVYYAVYSSNIHSRCVQLIHTHAHKHQCIFWCFKNLDWRQAPVCQFLSLGLRSTSFTHSNQSSKMSAGKQAHAELQIVQLLRSLRRTPFVKSLPLLYAACVLTISAKHTPHVVLGLGLGSGSVTPPLNLFMPLL